MRHSPNVVSVGDTYTGRGTSARVVAVMPENVIVRFTAGGKNWSWPLSYAEAGAKLDGR